jgi:putative transposase
VSDRVWKAYQNFFQRVKEKRKGKKIKVGFPRVKKFVVSLTYPQSGFKLNGNHLFLSKLGKVPIVLHRPIEGKVKTLTIKFSKSHEWYATFTAETGSKQFNPNGKPAVGIDLGLSNYATLSDGSVVQNMCFSKQNVVKARRLQRQISRKVKGSRNRRKAVLRVARFSNHITQRRHDFLHKLSHRLVNSYGLIAYENLGIVNMVKNHRLAGAIQDAGWGGFARMLGYKAARAGCRAVEVNSKNTSTTCSNCGAKHPMPLSKRTYECGECGLKMDRDLNAAKVILARGLDTAGRAGIYACGETTSTFQRGRASGFVEAGTIREGNVHAQ